MGRTVPVTMQVIVPGATSVNPASRTATASPASTARHSCGQTPGPASRTANAGTATSPCAAAYSIEACPTCAAALPTVISSAALTWITGTPGGGGPGSSGSRSVPPICSRETTLGTSSTGPGTSARACASPTVTVTPGELLHGRPVRAAGPSGDLADAARHPGGRARRATRRRRAGPGRPRARRPLRPPARRCAPRAAAPTAARSASPAPRRPARAGSPPVPRARPRSGRRAAPAGRAGRQAMGTRRVRPSAASARSTSSRVMPSTNSTTSR